MNPLIKRSNTDSPISGTHVGHEHRVSTTANTDDVSVIMKNQAEMSILTSQRIWASIWCKFGKTEGIWIGEENNRQKLDIQIKQEIQILGLIICNGDISNRAWEKKCVKLKIKYRSGTIKTQITEQEQEKIL